jgi:hypothetical protein
MVRPGGILTVATPERPSPTPSRTGTTDIITTLPRTPTATAPMVLVTSEVAASESTICLERGLRGISAMGFPFFVFIGKGSRTLQILSYVILMIL